MKKLNTLVIIIFLLLLIPLVQVDANSNVNKLKGRILLQVESHGEAWYIHPTTGERYYMADGNAAYNIMRDLGVGITNKNLEKIKTNINFAKQNSGKIFLQVEAHGEAYYINFNGKVHYLKDGTAAYSIMRDLGLGITNNDLNKILENGQIDTSKLKLLSNAEIIKQLKDSVVYIETKDGAGSGFIVDSNGYILTNAHVVQGVSDASVILSNNTTLSASVVGRDENIDLALLKVNKTGLKNSSLGDSVTVKQGDEIFTLGYPFGIKGDVSFKEGTISRKLTDSGHEYFEISADIHPGNSGGPLVNKYGQVVGINTASLGQSIQGVSVGETIKFAIPIDTAKNILSDLKNGRNIVVEHKQTESEPPTSSAVDPAVAFQMKAQCQTLGQQKQNKEDQDYRNGGLISNGGVVYGYSPRLNTCIYGSKYIIWSISNPNNIMSIGSSISNLLTDSIIWSESLLYKEAEDQNLVDLQYKKLYAMYDYLTQ